MNTLKNIIFILFEFIWYSIKKLFKIYTIITTFIQLVILFLILLIILFFFIIYKGYTNPF